MKLSAYPWHLELLRMKVSQSTLVLGERFPFARVLKPTTRAPAMSPLLFRKRIGARVRQAANDFLLFRRQI